MFTNYKYYMYERGGKKYVKAVSTYAGKRVEGVAVCSPLDNYDEEFGKKLAAARCNAKVAMKRSRNAARKYADLYKGRKYLDKLMEDTEAYIAAAREAEAEAAEQLIELEFNS